MYKYLEKTMIGKGDYVLHPFFGHCLVLDNYTEGVLVIEILANGQPIKVPTSSVLQIRKREVI